MSSVHSEIKKKWIFPLSNEVEMIQSTRLWVRMLLMDLYSVLWTASDLSIERFFMDSWKHLGMSSRKRSLLGWGPYLGCVSEERIKSLLLIMRESRIPPWFGVTPSTRAIYDKSGQGHPSFLYLSMEGSKMASNLLKCVRREQGYDNQSEHCCHKEQRFTRMGKTMQRATEEILTQDSVRWTLRDSLDLEE